MLAAIPCQHCGPVVLMKVNLHVNIIRHTNHHQAHITEFQVYKYGMLNTYLLLLPGMLSICRGGQL